MQELYYFRILLPECMFLIFQIYREMVKRKVSTNGDTTAKASKKAKKVSESLEEISHDTKIDMTHPDKVFLSILKPSTTGDFFSTYWEKKPLHIKREDQGL